MNNVILITGVGGPAGRSAASYVRGKGLRTIGADMRDVDTPVDVFRQLPPVSGETFIEELLALIGKERPSLLIPTVSEELPVVARLIADIRKRGCSVFISQPDAVDTAHDKLRTMRFFEHTDVGVPRTFDESTPREFVLQALGTPCLAKPCIGRGGRGVVVYRSDGELLAEKRSGLLYQEFVPGEEYDLNLFVANDGTVESSAVLRKTLLKQGVVGNAESVVRDDQRDVDDLGRRAAARLGLSGPVDMDIRRRVDGTPLLLEINARVGGNVLAAPEILDALLHAWTLELQT
jgi:carbamoylphosphate synthase large subunit